MRGVAEAVARIGRARETGESVAVYGDYDADGVSSTALLVECLRSIGIAARPFVPHREREGYGLNSPALGRLRDDGVTLVVAVDCGISGADEVAFARSLGMDVVVADHHHVPGTLPAAVAVVNPHQADCTYPFKDLCGVGIAYKLAQALLEREGRDPSEADRWLDLVALGTIADIVPLKGENRNLVARGLKRLRSLGRPGVRALAHEAGLAPDTISAEAVGFILAPRLNAAGRIGDPDQSLRLLLTDSAEEATAIAAQLGAWNRERQELTRSAVNRARADIAIRHASAGGVLPKLLLVADEDYPAGIVGLVAARLVEEYGRPALVAEMGADAVRGSARSIDGFHVTEALEQCRDFLVRFGGHAMAAGFTAHPDRFADFRERLEDIANQGITDDHVVPSLRVDAEIHLDKFVRHRDLYDVVAQLEPFGAENPRPIFVSKALRVAERQVVGRTAPGHLKLSLVVGAGRMDAIGFGMGDRLSGASERIDVAYRIERNTWNGQTTSRLRLLDFQSASR
jgi:single-stranded-DNA-specific exonuclease